MILLDGSWWCGGNRQRGIGRYLDTFLRFEMKDSKEDRVWIFPEWSTSEERNALLRTHGGKAMIAPTRADSGVQYQWWMDTLHEVQPKMIWLTSPFERPWSVVSLGNALFEPGIPVSAVVFDLLPFEYPRTILNSWSVADQDEYQARVKLLQQADHFVAISPYVERQLVGLLQVDAKKIQVPKFASTCDWIEVPTRKIVPHVSTSTHPLVVTISGGEWRKNLPGTLRYFAKSFSRNHRLVVICRLGRKERVRLQWLALQLGIFQRVQFANAVSEEVKWQYLFEAEVGVFLSRAEGLGIPLLEYSRASIPRIILSKQLEKAGFGEMLPAHYEVALEQ